MLRLRVRRDSPLDLSDGSAYPDAMPALRGHRAGASVPVPEAEEEGVVKLWTSRWSNRTLESSDVVAVGISRGTPRFRLGYRYRRLRELEPDGWMLGIEDDQRFEKVYAAKLDRLGVDKVADLLKNLSDEEGGADLCLLCFEADPARCHRSMFARFWHDKTGEVVEELTSCGASHKRQDPQEPLF